MVGVGDHGIHGKHGKGSFWVWSGEDGVSHGTRGIRGKKVVF